MSEQPKVDATTPERAAWHALSAYADKHNLGWAEFSGLVHAVLATPQAEPAVAEQARDFAETVNLMLGAVGYTSEYARQWPTEKASITFKRWFDAQIAQASQSTPPVAWGIRRKGKRAPHMITLVEKVAVQDQQRHEQTAKLTQSENPFELVALCVASQSTPPPESAGQGLSDGIEKAAKWVDDRREQFEREHGMIDPDTGFMEFRQIAQHDYDYELVEIAEGIRAILAANPTAQPDGGSKA